MEKEPEYRSKQAKEAVFKDFISDWQEATFLPKDLRRNLNEQCGLSIKAEMLVSKTKDSVKARIILKDGLKVETVLMMHNDGRNTVCVSSQVGCPLGCLFCATGKMGFKRNLDFSEIIEQVIFFERYLKSEANRHPMSIKPLDRHRVSNVTFMGMGEPFLNYDNVMKAVRILNDKNGMNIGARSISISTVGIVEGIKRFSNGFQVHPRTKRGGNDNRNKNEREPRYGVGVNLAISLHAPNNKLRSSLMPMNEKYPVEIILKEVDKYIRKTKRKVMFEYVLIKGVNDSDDLAKELAALMKKPLYFLNLILYNPIGNFKPSETKRVDGFKKILKKMNVNFSQRYRFGRDIKAACGQFSTSK